MSVKVGQIGLGYWGPNLARTVAGMDGAELTALCDADPESLARVGSRYSGIPLYSDASDLLGSDGLDAVLIATPADTHYVLVRSAIEAGKHVFVEKPMARTVSEAEDLVGRAEAAGVVLMPGHVFLYNAAVRKVRDLIVSGALGDIYYIYSQRLNLGQVRQDVNALWNFAPHDLSILGYWLGAEPTRVVARGFSYLQPGVEDVVFMTLDYPGGVGANVHISWLDPQKVRMMTVVGSEKMVIYDDTSADSRIRLIDKGVSRKVLNRASSDAGLGTFETFAEFQLLLRAGDVLIPKIDFVEPLQLELADFVESIRDGRSPVSDARSGVQVVRTLEAAQRSLTGVGQPVAV
jgi:predicted dehydrogenase